MQVDLIKKINDIVDVISYDDGFNWKTDDELFKLCKREVSEQLYLSGPKTDRIIKHLIEYDDIEATIKQFGRSS